MTISNSKAQYVPCPPVELPATTVYPIHHLWIPNFIKSSTTPSFHRRLRHLTHLPPSSSEFTILLGMSLFSICLQVPCPSEPCCFSGCDKVRWPLKMVQFLTVPYSPISRFFRVWNPQFFWAFHYYLLFVGVLPIGTLLLQWFWLCPVNANGSTVLDYPFSPFVFFFFCTGPYILIHKFLSNTLA